MERKLVRQGRNALTVTIPSAWAKKHGLLQGDIVSITEQKNELLISSRATEKRKTSISCKGYEKSQLYHIIQGKYIQGYDSITVLHDPLAPLQDIVSTMTGMIIAEQTRERTTIKSIVAVPEEDFSTILRRAGHILNNQAAILLAIAERKDDLDHIKNEEALLDTNLLYCLRYLNKYEAHEQAYKYFLLCATLESAGDQLSEIAKHIAGQRALALLIADNISLYIDLLFRKDFSMLYTALRAFRKAIHQKTFADGLSFSLAETLYNYIGFLVEDPTKHHI
jgi:phosphate uptake regulator